MKHLLVITSIMLFTFKLCASVPEQQMPISRSHLQMLDIQQFTQDKEIQVLKAGEEEFLTLKKEETTGVPRGIAFIIPDINQSITKQASVNSLYDQLNNYGWTSLLLTMPSQESVEVPVNLIEAQKNVTLDPNIDPNLSIKPSHQRDLFSAKFVTTIENKIEQRINSAIEMAKQHAGFYLFICQGKSCPWVTSLLTQNRIPSPDALILLSAHFPQSNVNQQFAEHLSETEFPVLELYKDYDSPWVTKHIRSRQILARKQFKTDYRQRKLSSHWGYLSQQKRAIKEIYGFLSAVGM